MAVIWGFMVIRDSREVMTIMEEVDSEADSAEVEAEVITVIEILEPIAEITPDGRTTVAADMEVEVVADMEVEEVEVIKVAAEVADNTVIEVLPTMVVVEEEVEVVVMTEAEEAMDPKRMLWDSTVTIVQIPE